MIDSKHVLAITMNCAKIHINLEDKIIHISAEGKHIAGIDAYYIKKD